MIAPLVQAWADRAAVNLHTWRMRRARIAGERHRAGLARTFARIRARQLRLNRAADHL